MIEHDALLDEDTFGGVALRRMPGLAVPFALVAASAAFFSIFALGVIGAFVGYIAWPDFDAAMITCAIGGAVYSIAFLPAAVLVHRASMRAARARLGSLVAEVDRRTVVATLLVVVAFAAVTQAPSLALAQLSELVHRFTQPALSIALLQRRVTPRLRCEDRPGSGSERRGVRDSLHALDCSARCDRRFRIRSVRLRQHE